MLFWRRIKEKKNILKENCFLMIDFTKENYCLMKDFTKENKNENEI